MNTEIMNCVATITLRNGRVLYASDYGFKCFPIGGTPFRKGKRPRRKTKGAS